jgi:hypothetical protein
MVSYCYPTTNLVNTLIANNDPRSLSGLILLCGIYQPIGIAARLTFRPNWRANKSRRRAEDYFYTKNKIALLWLAEINFLLAEASQRNLITAGSAQPITTQLKDHSNSGSWLCQLITWRQPHHIVTTGSFVHSKNGYDCIILEPNLGFWFRKNVANLVLFKQVQGRW